MLPPSEQLQELKKKKTLLRVSWHKQLLKKKPDYKFPMVTNSNSTGWNCDTFSYTLMARCHKTKRRKPADVNHTVPQWGQWSFSEQIRLRAHFLMRRNPWHTPTSLHSASCFRKNSISDTRQHPTKYIPQQREACRSSLREKRTWLKRGEVARNKRGPMRWYRGNVIGD